MSFALPKPPMHWQVLFEDHHEGLLRSQRPDLSQQAIDEEILDYRLLHPDQFPHLPFMRQADAEPERYRREIRERKARKESPISSRLSSQQGQGRPTSSSAPSDCGPSRSPAFLLTLSTATLHLLLSFVPDYEFFFRVPFLSHSLRRVYTQADLHRVYGQQRFGLSGEQWQKFSQRSWPRLALPVWRYGYTVEEEQREEELSKTTGTLSHLDQALAPSDVAVNILVEEGVLQLHLQGTDPSGKDWALECTHLYQHIHFSTVFLLRNGPNVTSAGQRIQYRLPHVIRALIVERLTTQLCDALVRGLMYREQYGAEEIQFCLVDYTAFTIPSVSSEPVLLLHRPYPSPNICSIHDLRIRVCHSQPPDQLSAEEATLFTPTEPDEIRPMEEEEEEEGEKKCAGQGPERSFDGDEAAVRQLRLRWMRLERMRSMIVIATVRTLSRFDDALYIGAELKGAVARSQVGQTVVVDLDPCPMVRLADGFAGVRADCAVHYVQLGGVAPLCRSQRLDILRLLLPALSVAVKEVRDEEAEDEKEKEDDEESSMRRDARLKRAVQVHMNRPGMQMAVASFNRYICRAADTWRKQQEDAERRERLLLGGDHAVVVPAHF